MSDHPTIGASQISAILGIHPKLTQHDVWTQLVHGVKQDDNEDMQRGREWEPDVLAKYERLTGKKLERNEPPQISFKLDYLHATPDAFGDDHLVEAKTAWSSEGWEVLPAHYYNQVQAQLYCLPTYHSADLAVMFSSFGFKIFENIKPDIDCQEKLNAAAERFIKDYVLPKKLPPIDHTEACRGAIVAQWPTEKTEKYLESDPTIDFELILGIQDAEIAMKVAEKAMDEKKNTLRALIGDHAGMKSKFARIDFKQQGMRKSTDYQAILNAIEPHLNQKMKKKLTELKERMTSTYPGPRTLRIYWSKDKGGEVEQSEA